MAKPRIFVSSTYYDLRQIREDLDQFITGQGYEPVRHETGSIAYGSKEAPEKYAYKEVELCDILVCIVGGRFGTEARDSAGHSITRIEIEHALERGIQVFIFIENAVFAEYQTYLINKDNKDMRFRHVSDRRVYDFIEMLHDLPCNNPIAPFGSSTEIVEYLRAQWAGLFQRFLTAERRMEEVRVVSEMKSISATLSQMVNYLTAQAKDKDQIIESILSTNHPAFAAFAKVTATPYRVFFQTRTELATWLTARGYGPVKKESWDKGSVAEWLNKGKREYIRMTKDIFDKDGHLVKIIPSSWDDKWITSGKLPEPKPKEPPQPPDDDEIPF